ncbi:MAG TPA: hypothetical protein VIK10_07055 [Prolixibacteraceae bacterium]
MQEKIHILISGYFIGNLTDTLSKEKMKVIITVFLMSFFVSMSGFSQEEKPNPNIEEIIIVFKTHFDNGYTDKAESVINEYATSMMDRALATLDKSLLMPKEKQFIWTLPSWPILEILQRCNSE